MIYPIATDANTFAGGAKVVALQEAQVCDQVTCRGCKYVYSVAQIVAGVGNMFFRGRRSSCRGRKQVCD